MEIKPTTWECVLTAKILNMAESCRPNCLLLNG